MIDKLISLHVLNSIFKNDATCSISAMAKMLYINCLTHHFTMKPATLSNLNDFVLTVNEIPNFNSFKRYFDELSKANLLRSNNDYLLFHSHWVKYMDISNMPNADSPMMQVYKSYDAGHYADELFSSMHLLELTAMKYALNKTQVNYLLNMFIKEQKATDKKYTNSGDVKKHFIYWCANNKDKAPKENTTKSNSKILGL